MAVADLETSARTTNRDVWGRRAGSLGSGGQRLGLGGVGSVMGSSWGHALTLGGPQQEDGGKRGWARLLTLMGQLRSAEAAGLGFRRGTHRTRSHGPGSAKLLLPASGGEEGASGLAPAEMPLPGSLGSPGQRGGAVLP